MNKLGNQSIGLQLLKAHSCRNSVNIVALSCAIVYICDVNVFL